ncbi:phospholipase D-like domain-containing protein [Solibacillus merdavium]|uniref:PLD phosphodiesterase domain-containing protein n=1 Tax=Solibacillus merdavium TaxID=2762218 RepID=A0ABR8XLV7_9BACL|nr:phospholipase D-like domain-containing protein [Solibacillus merdavium]MBD8032927.1 hypothetical protein [Solibacillus merdavium]
MELISVEGTLNFSNNEFGFQEVIDDLPNAKNVYIVTYNVSKNEDTLLNAIRNLNGIPVTIITNIPGRFMRYTSPTARTNAFRNISNYLDRLDTENYNCDLKSYFNFRNHSKIIMTDNVCYIGSGNFSDESFNNYESGIIIRNVETINKIKTQFIETIIKESILFSTSYYSIFKEIALDVIKRCQQELEKLEQGLFTSMEVGYCKDEIVLDRYTAFLPDDIFDNFYSMYEECNGMCYEIQEMFNDEINMEKLAKILRLIETQVEKMHSILEDLANFDFQNYQMRNAQESYYYSTGDPDDLQIAIEFGQTKAQERLEQIIEEYYDQKGFIERWVLRVPKLFELLIDELETLSDDMRCEIVYQNQDVINNTGL